MRQWQTSCKSHKGYANKSANFEFPQTLRDSSSPEELQGGNDHFLRSGGEMQDPMNANKFNSAWPKHNPTATHRTLPGLRAEPQPGRPALAPSSPIWLRSKSTRVTVALCAKASANACQGPVLANPSPWIWANSARHCGHWAGDLARPDGGHLPACRACRAVAGGFENAGAVANWGCELPCSWRGLVASYFSILFQARWSNDYTHSVIRLAGHG